MIKQYLQRAIVRWLLKFLPVAERLVRDPKRNLSARERYAVYARDRGRCRYCGRYVSYDEFHADHVYAWSKGGETTIANSVTSCGECNRNKSDKVGIWPIPLNLMKW